MNISPTPVNRVNDFNKVVDVAIERASAALTALGKYSEYDSPNAPSQVAVRDEARLAIQPSYDSLSRAIKLGTDPDFTSAYDRVEVADARDAKRALALIKKVATELVELPGQKSNVYAAREHLADAIGLLHRARW